MDPFRSYPALNRKLKKIAKKFKKFKNMITASFHAKYRLEKTEKERK